ncbi:MAG: TnpV protein [Synergistaceae bacterium]|jgi:maltooligosyltrehalose synthase|nr:TnpV protein [Synergistaceae bacterium]
MEDHPEAEYDDFDDRYEEMFYDQVAFDVEDRPIGQYGRLRKKFLEESKRASYDALLIKGMLNSHLVAWDRRARAMKAKLVAELSKRYPPPDRARNREEWKSHMEILEDRAEKIVLSRFLYK